MLKSYYQATEFLREFFINLIASLRFLKYSVFFILGIHNTNSIHLNIIERNISLL